MGKLRHGDFTGLAEFYSEYRPAYSKTVLSALLGICSKDVRDIDFVDVGAGTGIWTRMVENRGCRSVIAVEPNADMRCYGERDSRGGSITWCKGSSEDTGLAGNSCDFLTMASSLHWVDFNKTIKEFAQLIRKGGIFATLWNPRLIEVNPLLMEIENKLYEIAPDIKRKSSGRSGLTEVLTEKLVDNPYFEDILYLEGRHIEMQTPQRYMGIWWSVNDIRVQAGEERFKRFMDYIESRVSDLSFIEATYLTRAWAVRRK